MSQRTSDARSWRASNPSLQISLKEEIAHVDSIAVINFEDTMRFDKQTILYIIEYYIKGFRFVTKRSYSEFLYLWKEIKDDKIAVALPDIPPKKPLLGKTEEVIAERREAFDKFLKILIAEKVALDRLKEFLQTPNNLPYYGKISKKDSAKLVPPNNSVLTENDLSRGTGDSSLKPLNKSTISQVINPAMAGSAASSDNRSIQRREAYYIVETEKLLRSDSSIYYYLKITDKYSGEVKRIAKRYTEFKELHEQLKKSSGKKLKSQIPELPYKGKASALASGDDPKVTDYRKAALPQYLQTLLNHPELKINAAVRNFLKGRSDE